MIDILVQKRKDKQAAKRFFKKLLKSQESTPFEMMTDKLKSYRAAKQEIMPSVTHIQDQYANNRAENSHKRTRHGQVNNLFNLSRNLMKAEHYKIFRDRAFSDWSEISCA